MNQFDFVIIGSGIAGLSLALNVAQYGSVALVTKRSVGESNTAWAQGGVAADIAVSCKRTGLSAVSATDNYLTLIAVGTQL